MNKFWVSNCVKDGWKVLLTIEASLVFANIVIAQRQSNAQSNSTQSSLYSNLFFLTIPGDTDVVPGGNLYFSCKAGGDPPPRLFWRKDGVTLNLGNRNSDSNKRERRLVDGSSRLHIYQASEDDVGSYECVATSSKGTIVSRPARLLYRRRRTRPQIINRPSRIEVKKGQTIRLNCKATGFPKPNYAWYKDGGRLSSFHDRFRIEENGTLLIENAQLDDSAHYRCSASNYLGRASSAARVKVNLPFPEGKPKFTSRPRDARVTESEIIEFTCVAQGQPYPDVSWWNNNRRVQSTDRITVSNGGQHLRIEDIRQSDQGDYICQAQNRFGRVKISANLNVLSNPNRQPSRYNENEIDVSSVEHRKQRYNMPDHDRAIFDSLLPTTQSPIESYAGHMVHVTLQQGSSAQLNCEAMNQVASGAPDILYWMKDSQVLRLGPRVHQMGNGTLMVYNMSQSDTGIYECVAKRGRERRTTRTQVSIIPLQTGTPTIHNDKEPQSISNPSRYNYSIGGNEGNNADIMAALEEVSEKVDKAIEETVKKMISNNASKSDSVKALRYPVNEKDRKIARGNEIFERTIEKLSLERAGLPRPEVPFGLDDLLFSDDDLELLANVSGCEAHASRRLIDCATDMCFHVNFRTIDGTCNNIQRPLAGGSFTTFKRLIAPQYENDYFTPIGWSKDKLYNGFKLPSAREVSMNIIASSKTTLDNELSHMTMQWGQFLDHDIDLGMESVSRETFDDGITCSATCDNSPPCFPIDIPDNDQRAVNQSCIEFTRTSGACGSGSTSQLFGKKLQVREQLNQITSYLDGSQIYGSTDELAISLRNLTNDFGRLREGLSYDYSDKPFLPFNERHEIDCRRDPTEANIGCFLAGDVRANEQVALTSMHTIWFREHNRVSTRLRTLNPSWDGDRVYEESRKILGAELQHITYREWLPLIIGEKGMDTIGEYKGYNPSVDATISNVFAASAFRFGHTMVNSILPRLDGNFDPISEGNLPLRNAFFAPWRLIQEGGVDPILRGLFASAAKRNKPNEIMDTELTEHLFERAHIFALDLGALNIQRGRDHGLPGYTKWRRLCEGRNASIESWNELSDLITNQGILRKLEELYGHPANIDPWVGGLLEDPVDGARIGPTVTCLLVEQFKRLRDGDRFWYENPSTFKHQQLIQIKQASLSRVICDNGDDITSITPNVFLNMVKSNETGNGIINCLDLPSVALEMWSECKEDLEENVVISTRNKREIENKHRKQTIKEDTLSNGSEKVCIEYNGNIRRDGEVWTHSNIEADLKTCAECICKEHNVNCHLCECDRKP